MPDELIATNFSVTLHAVGKPVIKIGVFRQAKLLFVGSPMAEGGKPP
tara:strand:+ start:1719 stop:1859 length:141 start_codon:yes stop_codon:yes gene_type:complete